MCAIHSVKLHAMIASMFVMLLRVALWCVQLLCLHQVAAAAAAVHKEFVGNLIGVLGIIHVHTL
jgi:hypothetical protein